MAITNSRRPATSAARARLSRPAKKRAAEQDVAKSYNRFKTFGGQRYTGMAIGRSHHWTYDQGDWKETKVAPDRWEFTFAVTKRRKGHAPEGSGAPVGTEYHWYILAHQVVRKLDANDYTTSMSGLKFKLAHKRAGAQAWSSADPGQRKQLIRLLEGYLAELRKPPTAAAGDDQAKAKPRRVKAPA
jgi:hypothetical protein